MQHNDYEATVAWLFSRFPSYQHLGAIAYKPDLGNINALLELLGHPERELRFIHIAGSNGKGSTSAMLASILTESGEKVGLFTSPHIETFTERIRVNGSMVDESFVVGFCERIKELPISPSFFEITFAMALDYFREKNCSICVIETGLGGRLDATNCILPIVSVITNISLEHTQLLGDTEELIAFEKAGIIKPSVPVFIGRAGGKVKEVFQYTAKRNDSTITFCDENKFEHSFKLPLKGAYQQENFNTVLHVINWMNASGFKITNEHIRDGLQHLVHNTGFFGRLQHVSDKPSLLIDVSHNADGIQQTLKAVRSELKGELYVVFGTSSDKDVVAILTQFQPTDRLIFCAFSNPRSRSIDEWKKIAETLESSPPLFKGVDEALTYCKSMAKENDTILVTGSFFLLSDFFYFFKSNPLPE